MRVLHIITGLTDGGAEAVLYRACQRDQSNVHVVVSLQNRDKYGSLLEALGVRVYNLGITSGMTALKGAIRLARIIRSEAPDVIQTWMYHADLLGGLVARLVWRAPVYWGVHNTTLIPGQSSRTTIRIVHINARLSRWIPAGIAYCAQKAREVHSSLGYDDQHAVVIPNGYDISIFHHNVRARHALRHAWGVSDTTFVIGLVARLNPQKDHDNLFAAARILKDRGVEFRCMLVGTGMDTENTALRDQLARHGLQADETITLLGRRSDVPAVMNALDLHVLSSAYGEAFPNVLCEAMACGTPCATTDVGDAATIVANTGWVVSARQPEALARAIQAAQLEWAADHARWADRQLSARQRIVDHFDIDRMVDAYRRLWESGLRHTPQAGPTSTSETC